MIFVQTPEPPYWAVIFTSQLGEDSTGYDEMAKTMVDLVQGQTGYLGSESVRAVEGFGITVSYWRTEEDMLAWKAVTAHLIAQRLGKEHWYRGYSVRVAKVTRVYTHGV